MRELFLLDAANALSDGFAVLCAGFLADLPLQMRDGGGEEAAGAAGGVEHGLALLKIGIDHLHHELGDGTRGVELPGIASAAQVIEDLFIHVSKLAAALDVVEVHGFIQLLDDGQHLGARLHVVVGVLEDIAHDFGLGIALDVELLESGEDDIVDVLDQFTGLDARLLFALVVFDVFRPVSPAAVFRDGRLVFLAPVFGIIFPGLFTLVEYFEEEHPSELTDALGVAIDAIVFAHDVLDGLDGAGEIHERNDEIRMSRRIEGLTECSSGSAGDDDVDGEREPFRRQQDIGRMNIPDVEAFKAQGKRVFITDATPWQHGETSGGESGG